MIIEKSLANGTIASPPSKSMAHRALILASLASGKSVVHNIDFSEDIKATLSCIKELGATFSIQGNAETEKNAATLQKCSAFEENSVPLQKSSAVGKNPDSFKESSAVENHFSGNTIIVNGFGGKIGNAENDAENKNNAAKTNSATRIFNCNESGSTLRFFIPISLLSEKPSRFIGSEVLMTRPMAVYEKICKEQKIAFNATKDGIFTEGKLKSGRFEIPGNISSQFVTGLLFVLPLLKGDSEIVLTNSIESKPYIDMTIEAQKVFGIKAEWKNENTLFVGGNQTYRATETTVEGDYSNAAFFDAFNFLGGNVKVSGLNKKSLQGDKVYHEYFEKLSHGFSTIDISDCPDLGPILFVVAAALHGGEFLGTKRLKIKESDRGRVMCEELAKFGVKTLEEENKIVIYGENLSSPKTAIEGHNDHRIVMSLSVLLTLTGGKINGANAVNKSFPDFFARMKEVGISVKEDE